MDGGLLGARTRAVDADVLTDHVLLLVGADPLVLVDEPSGAQVADLAGDVLDVAVRLLVGVRLRLLLRDALVEGLAELLLERRVAVALGDRPLLRR